MPLTNAEKQKAHRQRQLAKMQRLEEGYCAILEALGDNQKPIAVQVRNIAQGALEA